jgi:hypothetical protein
VIGTVHNSEPSTEPEQPSVWTNWANRTVRVCGTILAAIAILGVGFWLTSTEVQDSMAEGWFHGFARIVWKLSGA